MAEVMIWNPIELVLWGIVLALGIVTAVLYYNRGKIRENKWEKTFLFGFAFLYFCVTISHVFYILSYFQIQGTYDNFTFYGNYSQVTPLYDLLLRLVWISSAIGILSFMFILKDFINARNILLL